MVRLCHENIPLRNIIHVAVNPLFKSIWSVQHNKILQIFKFIKKEEPGVWRGIRLPLHY